MNVKGLKFSYIAMLTSIKSRIVQFLCTFSVLSQIYVTKSLPSQPLSQQIVIYTNHDIYQQKSFPFIKCRLKVTEALKVPPR